MLFARFAFQACAIDHSTISPFRINNLALSVGRQIADCDKSFNLPRSLTVSLKYKTRPVAILILAGSTAYGVDACLR